MVEKRNCSFCGDPIEPGTGKMYIKKDGTVYSFCSNKCKKNRIDLGRVPRRTRWTVRYSELKASTLQREKAKTEPKGKDDPEKPVQRPKKKAAPKKKAVVKEVSGKPKESPGPVAKQTGEPAPSEPESQEEGS